MYELQVEGMSCNHCIGAVTRAVMQLDAAATVAIDLGTQTVRVDSTAALEGIAAALDEAGYPVKNSSVA